MEVLVTGAAGFIGSWLVDRLLADGHRVVGVDALTGALGRAGRDNLRRAFGHPGFAFVAADLAALERDRLTSLVAGRDAVAHLAGRPGVRASFGDFAAYARDNVVATQRLLDAIASVGERPRLVYASSSSVYGPAATLPTTESAVPAPGSPYGVSKLAGEQLCGVYVAGKGVDAVVLRFFTVYGPRQRPDMALHRFIAAALDGRPLPVLGTGEQVRDFTYVADVVDAVARCLDADLPGGAAYNVAGGAAVSVNDVVTALGEVLGRPPAVEHRPAQAGDVPVTRASTDRLRAATGWRPRTPLLDGLAAQVRWHREQRSGGSAGADVPAASRGADA